MSSRCFSSLLSLLLLLSLPLALFACTPSSASPNWSSVSFSALLSGNLSSVPFEATLKKDGDGLTLLYTGGPLSGVSVSCSVNGNAAGTDAVAEFSSPYFTSPTSLSSQSFARPASALFLLPAPLTVQTDEKAIFFTYDNGISLTLDLSGTPTDYSAPDLSFRVLDWSEK